jgi:ABC-type sugar transport system substrate-binding protein
VAGDEAKQIAIVSPYLSQQPATKEVVDDFTAAAEAKGWEVKTVDVNNDFARMNTEISGAAGRGVDAIVLGMGDRSRWVRASRPLRPPTSRSSGSTPASPTASPPTSPATTPSSARRRPRP